MRLQEDIDFTTLNWVKQELDETLKQARQALEAYVDDPADTSLMRFCATYLHQVQGTLRMVELYGAAMVVEEMERLAQTILEGAVKQKDEAYSVLMRGIVQLPDYLERLQSGHKDIPIVLLPLLNDLRAVRGEELFSESVLFSPDLAAVLPASAGGAAQALPEAEMKAQAARLRMAYQVSLLKWLRQGEVADAQRLQEALERLLRITHNDEAKRVWWVASALLEGVQAGGVESSPTVKLLFGKVDREIKRLVDSGEASFRASPPRELMKNLLYYVAHATGGGPQLADVRRTYALESLLPSQRELEHAKGSISGHNRALLDTVSAAIKDDLLRVKEALDIFLRNANNDPGELSAQVESLDRVGDTLGMLGLGVPRRVVMEQRKVVEEIAAKSRPADESTLLDVAGALLYVEASLDDHIERLGADTPESEAATGMELPKAEVRKILEALMKEASTNLAQAKHDIVAFVESPWDHAKVEQIPKLLEEVGGALRMLDLHKPSELMHGVVRFIDVELLRWRRVPTAEQMDKLADAVASIEYYLEATRDQRAGREKILDVTRQSLEALGYWPIPADDGMYPNEGDFAPTPEAAVPTLPIEPPAAMPAAFDSAVPAFHHEPETATAPQAAAPLTTMEMALAEPSFTLEPRVQPPEPELSEFLNFGSDVVTTSRKDSLRVESDDNVEPSADMPSIELTADTDIDSYLAKLGLGESTDQTDLDSAFIEAVEEPVHELREVVQIARGDGLDALVVGDTPATSAPAHDLAGLKFVSTEPTATPATQTPQVRYIDVEDEIEEEVEDHIEEEIEEEVPDDSASADAPAGTSFQAVGSDDIDEEIREVFVEEVQEEIDNLHRYVPLWRSDVHNMENLKPIRRSFHTLKGSGRLVGALALGEFSWKVENMLNRVLDKTIQPSPAAQSLIDSAIAALPGLLAALKGEGSPSADIAGIMSVADRLGTGEEAWLAPAKSKTKIVKRIVSRPVKRLVKRIVTRTVAVPVESEPVALEAHVPELPAVELTETFDITAPHPVLTTDHLVDEPEELSAGPLPNIDPVLFDILRSEVSQHLAVIDNYLADCSVRPQPATDVLLRAVHTLHGAIAMVDIPVIGHLLAPLEGYVKRLRAGDEVPAASGLAVLRDSSDLVRRVMAELEQPHPHLPNSDALTDRIIALRDAMPEPELAHTLYVSSEEDAPRHVPAVEAFSFDTSHVGAPAIEEPTIEMSSAAFFEPASEPRVQAFTASAAEPSLETEEPFTLELADDTVELPEPVLEMSSLGLSDLHETPAPYASEIILPAEDSAYIEESIEMADSTPLDSEEIGFEDLVDTDALMGVEGRFETAPANEPAPAAATAEDATLAQIEAELRATEAGDALHAHETAQLQQALQDVAPSESPGTESLLNLDEQNEFDRLIAAEAESHTAATTQPAAPIEEILAFGDDFAAPEFSEARFEEPVLLVETSHPVEEVAAPGAIEELSWLIEPAASIESGSVADFAQESTLESVEMATSQAEPESHMVVAPAAAEPAAEMVLPPIADDPQPDGKLDLPDMDEDLLEIFVQEGTDILDHSDTLIARLRDAPQDRDLVTGLQRDLHTLKGGARMAGLAPIGDLAHSMEALLEAISEGRRTMDRSSVESFERGYDRLHALVQRVSRRQAIAMPDHAVTRFDDLVSGRAQELAVAVPAEAPIHEDVDEIAVPVAEMPPEEAKLVETKAPEAKRVVRGGTRPGIPTFEDETVHVSQEMIRVRSDLLDSLVNYAGEVSIYRSRLEQQVTTFRFNLVEFEQTIGRLREQLRKMEMETETQIIARYQREHQDTGHNAFDPLELDRFSQLQQLSRALAESVSDLMSIQGLLDDLTRQSETLLLQQSRVSSDLQEGLMRTRMVPFDSLVPSLRRTLRQAAQEIGKRAQLKVEGAQGEMDRNLLERMKAPFEHMLRNALAHGIEDPTERRNAGKPEEGTVTIHVSREATEVVIRVADDGRGFNRDAIRKKAIERGLLSPEAQLSDRDLYAFVLETGFSTAEQVTQLAGRGVGMDVVNNEIKQLGGTLTIDSERGKGTTFSIRLPFTLAVTQAILVRLGESTYAIPMSSVQGVVRITREDLERRLSTGNPSYAYAGEEFFIYDLAQLLNVPGARAILEDTQLPLLMTRSGDQRAAVRIDGVIGSREVVVKSVGPQISSVPGIFGATIMGDGSVVMILDLSPLVRRSAALRARVADGEAIEVSTIMAAPAPEVERRKPLVMVVDDSITMRKVTTRVLERNDLEVITAKDGLDAVEKLQDKVPDVMLLDIEMPRMDGYELATYMKNDARLKLVPIVMITSRTGDKHRQRALEIGVDRYLGKPYQEADLLRNVQDMLALMRTER
jgi:chemosensory pili system protein ChpA (sensor histidine kinase/response regulator)